MKKRLLSRLLPYKLGNKLFVAVSIIGVFLVISLAITVASISGRLLYQGAKDNLVSQSKQVTNAFDQYAEILRNTVMSASQQLSIQRLFVETSGLYDDYITYRDSYSYVKNVNGFYEWIDVYILVKDRHYMMSSSAGDTTSDYTKKGVEEKDWFKELEKSNKGILLQSNFVSPTSGENAFSLAYTVQNSYNWNKEGYIIATLDKTVLNKLLYKTGLEENGVVLVVTPQGEIAYNSDSALFSDELVKRELYPQFKNGDKYVSESKEEYVYSSCKSETTGWDFVVFSNTRQAKRQILQFQLLVFLVASIALALLLAVARLLSKVYTHPINQVIEFIKQTEKNEFANQCDLQLDGELGDLVNSFNEMVTSVRQNQILRKKAEIDALQKQIDPHFLFNTLESIKVLAQQRNTKSVVSMIQKLSDVFRYNTNRSNSQTAQIDQELILIRNYLDIQSVRFGNRIQVEYDICNETLQYTTLKFILQPIVENSIRHSMEEMKSSYQLSIKCYFESEIIVFVVRDNGVGMSRELLSELREHVLSKTTAKDNEAFGIGLKNIQERISLFYGDDYGLSIDSELGQFTEVKVRIPKTPKEGEKQ